MITILIVFEGGFVIVSNLTVYKFLEKSSTEEDIICSNIAVVNIPLNGAN